MTMPAAIGSSSVQQSSASGRVRSLSAIGVVPILLVLIVVVMSVVVPHFLGAINIINIVRNAALLAIVSCGQALVLIVGGFDLSVGAVIALASEVTAETMQWAGAVWPDNTAAVVTLGVIAGLGAGLAVGFINGFCVAVLRISGFIATLGTMSVTAGVALIMTNGIPVYGLPGSFISQFGRARWLQLPSFFYIGIVIILVLAFVQRRTLLGRYIYAIGGNLDASMVSGVPVRRYQIAAYMLSGLLAAVTGVLLTAQVGSGQASFGGNPMMLQSIAAAVIGGVSLHGGIGRVEMVAVSALFLSVLTNALNLLRIDSRLQPMFLGLVLVCAVALDEVRRRRANHE